METCDVVVCDVDGVINIFADEAFVWDDIQDKRFVIDGKVSALFTFSPTVARELNTIADSFPFFWLTSWNKKTDVLAEVGFPKARVLHVEKGRETESKIEQVAFLAKTQRVLWIDDFAEEWREFLPAEVLANVISLQPDHRQGLITSDLERIKECCGMLAG